MSKLNYQANKCILEVTIIHSLQNITDQIQRFNNVADIAQYFGTLKKSTVTYPTLLSDPDLVYQFQFDNTQLSCELSVIDSTNDDSDNFQFTVWNFPQDVAMVKGDYLLFKFYYKSDPDTYTTYHGTIKTMASSWDNASLKTVIKGPLVDQDLLSNYSIYNKYPKLTYYSDVTDFVENELKFNFTTTVPGFVTKLPLTTPILTRGKTVTDLMKDICSQASARLGIECSWKFVNNNTILVYKKSDLGSKLLNEQYNLRVPSINYNDIFLLAPNETNYTLTSYGIPTLKAGIVFYVEVTNVPRYITAKSEYYIIEEIKHSITLTDGYTMTCYVTLANTSST